MYTSMPHTLLACDETRGFLVSMLLHLVVSLLIKLVKTVEFYFVSIQIQVLIIIIYNSPMFQKELVLKSTSVSIVKSLTVNS